MGEAEAIAPARVPVYKPIKMNRAIWPTGAGTGGALALAGCLYLVRLGRWAGDRTWRKRLVLILHVGYAFVPIGFLLNAASA